MSALDSLLYPTSVPEGSMSLPAVSDPVHCWNPPHPEPSLKQRPLTNIFEHCGASAYRSSTLRFNHHPDTSSHYSKTQHAPALKRVDSQTASLTDRRTYLALRSTLNPTLPTPTLDLPYSSTYPKANPCSDPKPTITHLYSPYTYVIPTLRLPHTSPKPTLYHS